jgi:IS1 family transposase
MISAIKLNERSEATLSSLAYFAQESGVDPQDDDVFAYSSVLVEGENIGKIKSDAKKQRKPKP